VSEIVLITPPDKIFNQNRNVLFIHPNAGIKEQANNILQKHQNPLNLYIYEQDNESHDIDWLLTVAKFSDVVVIDVDNSPLQIRMLASYIISLPQTYWLTIEDDMCYNKLSNKRIYGLDTIESLIGGSFETEQQ